MNSLKDVTSIVYCFWIYAILVLLWHIKMYRQDRNWNPDIRKYRLASFISESASIVPTS